MTDIRRIGHPWARVLPVNQREHVTERPSTPTEPLGNESAPPQMERRRNPDRRRQQRKVVVERRIGHQRRRPRIDIDV